MILPNLGGGDTHKVSRNFHRRVAVALLWSAARKAGT